MQLPLVSILIPCFNVEGYVENAIASVLRQTYTNLEIWIIDDGSTDNTLAKINSFDDSRIQVIHFSENRKKVGAVNEVLLKVNGELIAFQDADDWSEVNRIERQVKQFAYDADLGVCFTNYRYVGANPFLPGKISFSDMELKEEFFNFYRNEHRDSSPTICGTMMISKAALIKTRGYHPYFAGRVAEDIHWIYRILKSFKGITINEVLYNYRLRADSFTGILARGVNAKYAYSWQLLSKIIEKDMKDGLDVLAPENLAILKSLELEACEAALTEKTQQLHKSINAYETSLSFRLGHFLLSPYRILKSAMRKSKRTSL